MEKKSKIYIVLACVVAIIAVLVRVFLPNSDLNNSIGEIQNNIESQIVITEETQEIVNETIEATIEGENLSTSEFIDSSIEEEEEIVDEGAIETDAVVEQENIAYEGTETGNGLSLLGAYQGLTYYSQADSRWANVMYSSKGDRSQTMKSSACGPTSAAMVVSSSKGAILPTTMAQIALNNGYRTANSGTAWAFYPFVADYFDFNEYYTTSNFNTAMNYLKMDRDNDGQSDYFIIASCGSGLFTTGGHYIVLADIDGSTIKVYDPYIYSGKFATASRRAANVRVSGNTAYVTESNFQKYSNYKSFWIYSNDKGLGTSTSQFKAGQRVLVNIPVGICCIQGDHALVDDSRNQFWIHTSVIKDNNSIYALADIAYAAGSNYLLQIFDNQFWAIVTNMSNAPAPTSGTQTANNTSSRPAAAYSTGRYITTSNLNVRSGPGTNYSAKKSSQLSANARQQNARLGGTYNGYRRGVSFTVTKVSGN